MAGKTKSTGTTEAVTGVRKQNRSLDFSAKYPEYHVVIVSKKSKMHQGYTTQYDYFLGEGFIELEQLPHPDKVVMGETWDNYRERKQISIDLHRANMGRVTAADPDRKHTGVQQVTEGDDIQTVQVTTKFGGEG